MEARAIRCSACGALVGDNAVSCPYCGASLARVACPGCFGIVPVDAKHCPTCGAPVKDEVVSQKGDIRCPVCKMEMEYSALGDVGVSNCLRCGGTWIERETFENLTADREQRGLVLMGLGSNVESAVPEQSISYRPCPECGHLMNRSNYARISGVILDTCKSHGVWFDRDELRRVLSFIEKGGLLKAQEREKLKLEEARREAESAKAMASVGGPVCNDGFFGGRKPRGRTLELSDIQDFYDFMVGLFKR